MSHPHLENINIESVTPLPTPREMKAMLPHTPTTLSRVEHGRETLERIFHG